MSITYSSGTITIAGETATPEDLWDADQAGGWGVVSRQGLSARYQYYIAAQISLGVGGHFVCEELDVIINGGNKSPIVSTSSDSGMRFGAIDANGDTYNGCSVTFVCTSTASLIEFPVGAANLSDACDFEVYASTVDGYFAGPNGLFGRFYRGDDQIVKIRDSTFQNMKFGMRLRGTASFMKDVEFSNISGIFSPFTTYGELGGGISGILVRKSYQGAYFQSDFGDATVRNFAARNNTRTMNFRNVAGSSGNYYSIDGNLETPLDIFWQFNNTVSKFFVQFSFNKTYKKASDSSPLEGARVYIEDADGTQATNATTNASGVLAEQVLTKETYRYLDGDTPTALTPHVVKVRKYGYLFTEFSISVDAKIEGVDFVGDNPFVVANEATAGAYTGIAINGAAKTIAVSGARTLQELYDYSQWWAAQSGNIQYDAPLSTADGVGFVLDSGWSMSVTGSLTGTGTLATKPTVASGGFFEDADGAIWEAGGSLYYAAHAYIRVKDAVSSDDIEGAVVGFGDGATQTRLLYNTSLAEDTLVTDAGGAAEGYFVYRIGATTASVAITIANANLIDGTRVQLYNVTQGTELENTIVSGGAGYSYVATLGPGQEVESGDTIRLRSDHIDSDELTEFGTASSAGVPFLGVPIADTVYPQWGVDGSTVTEFSADTSGHVQININDPDGKTTKRRLLAWLRWYTTTEDGIRSFFGALTTTSAADARINQDVVDLQLDNISGTKVTFTDLDIRLYRADNTDIIADSSDSIHLDYAGVPFVSVVTTSGAEVVDAAEVAGAIATTLSAQHGAGSWEGGGGLTEGGIATAVRAELGTELGRIDATISSRLATASYTAPPTTAAIDAALTATHGAGSWAGATAGDTAAAVRAELATELARVDVATSTRLASVDYTAPPTTLDIDAQLSLTHSAGSWAGATAEETATAVRSELDPELGRIDASVSTRLSAADYVAAPTPAEIDSALTAGHGAGSWAGATAAATAIAVRSELAVELAYMDIAISTRLADTDYSAPDNATLTIVKDILEADEELAPTSATKRHKDTKAILVQKTVSGGNNTSTISLVEA
jgi:hypothetical protein